VDGLTGIFIDPDVNVRCIFVPGWIGPIIVSLKRTPNRIELENRCQYNPSQHRVNSEFRAAAASRTGEAK
jgi:hypothetical protein